MLRGFILIINGIGILIDMKIISYLTYVCNVCGYVNNKHDVPVMINYSWTWKSLNKCWYVDY